MPTSGRLNAAGLGFGKVTELNEPKPIDFPNRHSLLPVLLRNKQQRDATATSHYPKVQ
jgi:hypothetical protein